MNIWTNLKSKMAAAASDWQRHLHVNCSNSTGQNLTKFATQSYFIAKSETAKLLGTCYLCDNRGRIQEYFEIRA